MIIENCINGILYSFSRVTLWLREVFISFKTKCHKKLQSYKMYYYHHIHKDIFELNIIFKEYLSFFVKIRSKIYILYFQIFCLNDLGQRLPTNGSWRMFWRFRDWSSFVGKIDILFQLLKKEKKNNFNSK